MTLTSTQLPFLMKRAKFSELPILHQIAIVHYCQECKVSWDGVPDGAKPAWTKDCPWTKILISNYDKQFGNKESFAYGPLPVGDVAELLGNSENMMLHGFSQFLDYHQWIKEEYGFGGDEHVGPPIITFSDADNSADLDRGWGAFHKAYDKGQEQIEMITFLAFDTLGVF